MSAEELERVTGFTFFRSYGDASQCLPDEQRLRFYDAMRDFAFDGIVPDFTDDTMLHLAWTLALPNLEKSIQNQINGRKGGRPKKDPDEPKDG